MAATSSSVSPSVRARWPSFRPASTLRAASSFAAPDLSRLASFSRRGMAFSTVAISAKMSSVLIVSTSDCGSTLPATWVTSGSPKKRTTSAMASVSRMFARNWLPRPSPGSLRPQTGDVHELHRGGHDLRRMVDFGQRLQAVVGHRHDAHVGLDGGERVVGGQTALVGHRREQAWTCRHSEAPRYRLREPFKFLTRKSVSKLNHYRTLFCNSQVRPRKTARARQVPAIGPPLGQVGFRQRRAQNKGRVQVPVGPAASR